LASKAGSGTKRKAGEAGKGSDSDVPADIGEPPAKKQKGKGGALESPAKARASGPTKKK
jgi:hypothetical protein